MPISVFFTILMTTLVFTSSAEARNQTTLVGERLLTPRAEAVKPAQVQISQATTIARVVVKFRDASKVRLYNDQLVSVAGERTDDASSILTPYLSGRMNRLIMSVSEREFDNKREMLQASSGQALADMNGYYSIDVQNHSEAETIINQLNSLDIVEIAYFEPAPEPAGDIEPPTADFQPNQDYREAAPAGVDADYANTLPGGDGSGVKIIDIEGNWMTTHEDLEKALGGIITPNVIDDQSWRDHGTAVIGEMIGGDNGYGVTGICPGADIGMVSIGGISTAEALFLATENLQPGDLILIELHAPGPHYDFESRSDQVGYVMMEYWQSNYDAIQYAWANGITVIEAAGNGGENYDDVGIYGQIFDTTYRNSHAIVVGAGYPAASSQDRIKHGFSCYGERVNVQGYGSGVYTTGYGGLFAPGGDENQFYTSSFSGTSSASPIITGAAACLQGYYKANYGTYLTSDMIRDLLTSTGSPQLGNTALHIGPRPDLAAAIAAVSPPPSLYTSPLFFDTSLSVIETGTKEIWLLNRSASEALDFSVIGNDSLAKIAMPDWLLATPSTGTIAPSDSTLVEITIDATLLEATSTKYKGILEIYWSTTGQSLDSLTYFPVFVDVPCADDSYNAESTSDPEGPSYSWISAKDLGVKLPNAEFFNTLAGAPLDDGSTGPHEIGFDFRFYGIDYNTISIAVNGALSFTATDVNVNGYYSGFGIPGAPFTTFIAPFYADLIIDVGFDPAAGIYLYRSPGNDTLVIEWHRVANFNSSGTAADFEIILTDEGIIKFQYQDIESTGLDLSALVGIQETGCFALEYFNSGGDPTHQPTNGSAIQFTSNTGCCIGRTGNINCDPDDIVDIGDLTEMINYLFISFPELCCEAEADVNGDGVVDIGDLTKIIDRLFITYTNLFLCQ